MASLERAAEILRRYILDVSIEPASELARYQIPPGPDVLKFPGYILLEGTVNRMGEEFLEIYGRSVREGSPNHLILSFAIHEDPKPPLR